MVISYKIYFFVVVGNCNIQYLSFGSLELLLVLVALNLEAMMRFSIYKKNIKQREKGQNSQDTHTRFQTQKHSTVYEVAQVSALQKYCIAWALAYSALGKYSYPLHFFTLQPQT